MMRKFLFLYCFLVSTSGAFAQKETWLDVELLNSISALTGSGDGYHVQLSGKKMLKDTSAWFIKGGVIVSNAYVISPNKTTRMALFSESNIQAYRSGGFGTHIGISKKKTWEKDGKLSIWYSVQLYYSHTWESLTYTITEPYFGNQSFYLERKRLRSIGLQFAPSASLKVYQNFYVTTELTFGMGTNPTRNDSFNALYLQELGTVFTKRSQALIFGFNGGLKLSYLFK